jgi:hypothetical protein
MSRRAIGDRVNLQPERSINGKSVEPGAEFETGMLSSDRLLGKRIAVGGRCESLSPEAWRPIVLADSAVVWEGPVVDSLDAADGAARVHARQSMDRAVAKIFE